MTNEGSGADRAPHVLGIGDTTAGKRDTHELIMMAERAAAAASLNAAPSLTTGAQKWADDVLAGEIPDAATYVSRRPWLDEAIHPVDRFELMWDAAGRCGVGVPEHEIASVRAARARWEAARSVAFGLDPFLAAQASRQHSAARDPE